MNDEQEVNPYRSPASEPRRETEERPLGIPLTISGTVSAEMLLEAGRLHHKKQASDSPLPGWVFKLILFLIPIVLVVCLVLFSPPGARGGILMFVPVLVAVLVVLMFGALMIQKIVAGRNKAVGQQITFRIDADELTMDSENNKRRVPWERFESVVSSPTMIVLHEHKYVMQAIPKCFLDDERMWPSLQAFVEAKVHAEKADSVGAEPVGPVTPQRNLSQPPPDGAVVFEGKALWEEYREWARRSSTTRFSGRAILVILFCMLTGVFLTTALQAPDGLAELFSIRGLPMWIIWLLFLVLFGRQWFSVSPIMRAHEEAWRQLLENAVVQGWANEEEIHMCDGTNESRHQWLQLSRCEH
ncbi:MAG: YcxB family protein, partial [Planctomycetales bacterium]